MNDNLKPAVSNATLIYVSLSALLANPFRDMVMFPIDRGTKVPSLKESMVKTGVWPSIIARPKDNLIDGKPVTQEELMSMIESGYDFSGVEWQKAFGHHRQVAVEELNYSEMPIIPQITTDENMLLMMANENKEGFGSNINSQLETVRQVKAKLEESIQDYDDYDGYKNDGGEFFATQKAFKNAQTQGVGFKTIKRFLGDTWSDRDVRAPVAVLKAVDDGLFMQEDIVGVPTIGLLEGIASIARTLYEGHTPKAKDAEPVPAPNWPDYFKQEAMAQVINRCQLNADKGKHDSTVTVSLLDKARLALQKSGVNPASFLRAGKGNTAFDVYGAIRELILIADAPLEKNLLAIDELAESDGFSEWPDMAETQEKLRKSAKTLAEGGTEEAPEDSEGLDPTTEGDVNSAINEGEEQAGEGILPGDDAFGDLGPESGPVPINQLVSTVAGDCEVMGSRIDALLPRTGEFSADDTYAMAVQDLLNKVALLTVSTLGKPALVEAFNLATKERAVEEVVEEVVEEEPATPDSTIE